MIRIIIQLLRHDLAVAFKNKTIYLIICIPLFVYSVLTLVDPTGARDDGVKIALLETGSYAPVFLESMTAAPGHFAVRWAEDKEEALNLLKEQEVDGILVPYDGDADRLLLTVLQQESTQTLVIMQRLSALQASAAGKEQGWIAAIKSLQAATVKQQTMPTWILMMVLIVGFIVLPVQVAEEKEKQLLLGWMQTPVREVEWLAAKLVYGVVLMLASVAVLQLTGGVLSWTSGVLYLAILFAGGFCFAALGICIGLLCRNPASARTLGLIFYLPMLLPAALSDMSQELRNIAPLIPSYYFYGPVRALFLEGGGGGRFIQSWLGLVAIGLVACFASHRLLKKRWLM